MGQGSDIKMAQVVAYALGAPVELVKIEDNDTTVNMNNSVTGGSSTSDVLSMGKAGGSPYELIFLALCAGWYELTLFALYEVFQSYSSSCVVQRHCQPAKS